MNTNGVFIRWGKLGAYFAWRGVKVLCGGNSQSKCGSAVTDKFSLIICIEEAGMKQLSFSSRKFFKIWLLNLV